MSSSCQWQLRLVTAKRGFAGAVSLMYREVLLLRRGPIDTSPHFFHRFDGTARLQTRVRFPQEMLRHTRHFAPCAHAALDTQDRGHISAAVCLWREVAQIEPVPSMAAPSHCNFTLLEVCRPEAQHAERASHKRATWCTRFPRQRAVWLAETFQPKRRCPKLLEPTCPLQRCSTPQCSLDFASLSLNIWGSPPCEPLKRTVLAKLYYFAFCVRGACTMSTPFGQRLCLSGLFPSVAISPKRACDLLRPILVWSVSRSCASVRLRLFVSMLTKNPRQQFLRAFPLLASLFPLSPAAAADFLVSICHSPSPALRIHLADVLSPDALRLAFSSSVCSSVRSCSKASFFCNQSEELFLFADSPNSLQILCVTYVRHFCLLFKAPCEFLAPPLHVPRLTTSSCNSANSCRSSFFFRSSVSSCSPSASSIVVALPLRPPATSLLGAKLYSIHLGLSNPLIHGHTHQRQKLRQLDTKTRLNGSATQRTRPDPHQVQARGKQRQFKQPSHQKSAPSYPATTKPHVCHIIRQNSRTNRSPPADALRAVMFAVVFYSITHGPWQRAEADRPKSVDMEAGEFENGRDFACT